MLKPVCRKVVFLALFIFCYKQQLLAQDWDDKINLLATKGTVFLIENSDPFDLLDVKIVKEQLVIKVRYVGGYVKHDFEIVWPVILSDIYHPSFAVVLNHDNNYDLQEKLITQVLRFDIEESRLGLSPQTLQNTHITVINGSNRDQKVVTP